MVAGELETAQSELAHEMADVKRVTGRIEAAIQCDGALSEALSERFFVGAVGDEAAPLEVFEEVHGMCRKTKQARQGKGGAKEDLIWNSGTLELRKDEKAVFDFGIFQPS